MARSPWIISPLGDAAFWIASPLAIFPLVAWLSHAYFSAEQISLAVVSFASIGHHMPGFIRAYADRELFRRFRWRFLMAPPTALAAAVAFSWFDFHALTLVLLFWATWHVMMQTYGFMRIYDLKQGRTAWRGARLDAALCASVFVAGVVFSDARVSAIAELLWQIGCPRFGPHVLSVSRYAVGFLTAGCACAFLVETMTQRRQGIGPNWPKILSVTSTGILYWLCGTLTQDVLIGVATFEVFHAVQYNAIVWAYNCNSRRRDKQALGLLSFMFQDRLALLGLYLAVIALFGSLRLGSEYLATPLAQQLLRAALVASTILHFYYDGFIWKVSEATTAQNLGIREPGRGRAVSRAAWQAVALVSLAIGLFAWEVSAHADQSDEAELIAHLSRLTPDLPEIQTRAARAALAAERSDEAIRLARRAVEARPRSHDAHSVLGLALLQDNRYADAAASFRAAIELQPLVWQNHCDLASACVGLGDWETAEQCFGAAENLSPKSASLHAAWGQACALRGELDSAIRHWQLALACDPASTAALRLATVLSATGEHREAVRIAREQFERNSNLASNRCLGQALLASGQPRAAAEYLQTAANLDPTNAEAWTVLGKALLAANRPESALEALEKACATDPNSFAAHFELGVGLQTVGRLDGAFVAYRKCTDLRPDHAQAFGNLGAVLMQGGDFVHAESALRRAVMLAPGEGALHHNLAILLNETGRATESRAQFDRAIELGFLAPGAAAQTAPVADER